MPVDTCHTHVKVFVRIVPVPDLLNPLNRKRYIFVPITGKTTFEFIGISFVERIPLGSLPSSTQPDNELLRMYKVSLLSLTWLYF